MGVFMGFLAQPRNDSVRGVQYMYCMMRACIVVKIGGSKKRKLNKKRLLNENRGIHKFCRNRVEYAISIIGLGRRTPLED